MNSSAKVPIGFATVVGQLVALAQFAGAAVVLIVGDQSLKAEAAHILLAGGSLTQVTVLAGRYLQAHAQIRADALTAMSLLERGLPSLQEEIASPPPAEVV